MAVDLEALSSKGDYRKPLQSPRSLFPEARRSPTRAPLPTAGGRQHPWVPAAHRPTAGLPIHSHRPTAPPSRVSSNFAASVNTSMFGWLAFPPLNSEQTSPSAHTPWPNPSAPDWQGNPIPTLPARSVGSCSSPNKSQLPSSGCFTIKVSHSPFFIIYFFFPPFSCSRLPPFPG